MHEITTQVPPLLQVFYNLLSISIYSGDYVLSGVHRRAVSHKPSFRPQGILIFHNHTMRTLGQVIPPYNAQKLIALCPVMKQDHNFNICNAGRNSPTGAHLFPTTIASWNLLCNSIYLLGIMYSPACIDEQCLVKPFLVHLWSLDLCLTQPYNEKTGRITAKQ